MSSELNPKNVSGEKAAITNPVSYEPQDVNAGAILKYLAALLLTVFASMLIVWGVYRGLLARAPREPSYASPLRESAGRILPPEPRLQGAPGHQLSPQEEFRQMRAEAEAALKSYDWVDEKAGIAKIPIDQAMKLLVERGPSSIETEKKTKTSPQRAIVPAAKAPEKQP
jgi:hypothetical protein